MKLSDVEQILKDVEELLGSGLDLPDVVEVAIRKLLNVVEALQNTKSLRQSYRRFSITSVVNIVFRQD